MFERLAVERLYCYLRTKMICKNVRLYDATNMSLKINVSRTQVIGFGGKMDCKLHINIRASR